MLLIPPICKLWTIFLIVSPGTSNTDVLTRAAGWLAGTTVGAVFAAGVVGGVCVFVYRRFGRRLVQCLDWLPRRRRRRGETISITVNNAGPQPGVSSANGTSTPAHGLHTTAAQGGATCVGLPLPQLTDDDPNRTLGHTQLGPDHTKLPSTSSSSEEQRLYSARDSHQSSQSE